MNLYGGIEAGGTKFNCIIASGPENILAETKIPTTTPDETFSNVYNFFANSPAPLTSIGVACFGPVDLNPKSPTYGFITTTPKPGWKMTDVVGRLSATTHLPIAFETDVNGAAISEQRWGAGQGMDSVLYLTIGTGVGGGFVNAGQPLHGLIHPEMGHILLRRDPSVDPFKGFCPFHGDCLEGLVAGPAIKARVGQPAETLSDDHPVWDLIANYIAQALSNYIYILSPQRIILGGGVMHKKILFPLIRRKTQELLNGYINSPSVLSEIEQYIVAPGLGEYSGMLGAIALAMDLMRK